MATVGSNQKGSPTIFSPVDIEVWVVRQQGQDFFIVATPHCAAESNVSSTVVMTLKEHQRNTVFNEQRKEAFFFLRKKKKNQLRKKVFLFNHNSKKRTVERAFEGWLQIPF